MGDDLDRPNVLLLVVDCLRYDHVQGFERTLAALNPQALFHNAWATGPMSDGNFASILTGTHPDTHGVMTQCMQTDLPTLPQALGEVGYATLLASVTYPDGLPKGLSDFYYRGVGEFVKLGWRTFDADRVQGEVLKLDEPWFALLRPMDLHEPNLSGDYNYAGRIGELDLPLANLVEAVLGKCPDTVVVLTADHGQGLGERDMWNHRQGLWWFLTHVPLVYSHPSFGGRECHALHQHMDLTATLAGLCGVDFHSEGVDWSHYLREGAVPGHGLREKVIGYSMGSERKMLGDYDRLWRYRSVRTYFWSYYEKHRRQVWAEPELYMALCDPSEQRNLAGEVEFASKVAELRMLMGWPDGAEYTVEEEDAVLKRLRAIGYAD